MFWVVLAWAGASLCRFAVLWLRYKQGFFYHTSCTTTAGHVEENSGSLCLFRGCCVESGIGLCRAEQRGGSGAGGLRFCWGAWKSVRAVAEPPSPSTSRHPPHSPPNTHIMYVWVAHFHGSVWAHISASRTQKLARLGSSLSVQHGGSGVDIACKAGNRKYKMALFTTGFSSFTHQRDSYHKRAELIKHLLKQTAAIVHFFYSYFFFHTTELYIVSDLLLPVYTSSLALKCNTYLGGVNVLNNRQSAYCVSGLNDRYLRVELVLIDMLTAV